MKLKTRQTTETEIEIPVPSFYKSKSSNDYIGILDEQTIISFYIAPDFSLIKNGKPLVLDNELVSAFLNYDKIDELEFCTKHIEILESFSLEPKLVS